MGFWEKARGGRVTFIFSLKLSYCHTVILSNYKKMELFRCLGVGKFDSLRVGELESLTVGGLGRQMHPHFSVQLSNCQHAKGMKPLSPISSQTSPRLRVKRKQRVKRLAPASIVLRTPCLAKATSETT